MASGVRGPVDQVVVLVHAQRAVRGEALDSEGSGGADDLPVFMGPVVEVFELGLGRDGGVDLLLAGGACLPPAVVQCRDSGFPRVKGSVGKVIQGIAPAKLTIQDDQRLGVHLLLDVQGRRLNDEVRPVLGVLAAPDELRVEVAVAPLVGHLDGVQLLVPHDRLILRGGDVLAVLALVGQGLDCFQGPLSSLLRHPFVLPTAFVTTSPNDAPPPLRDDPYVTGARPEPSAAPPRRRPAPLPP